MTTHANGGCVSPEDLAALHDGELAGAAREDAQRHVAACAACAKALRRLERTSGLLAALPREEASEDLVSRVAGAATGATPDRWRKLRRTVIGLGSAAAIVGVVALMAYVVPKQREADSVAERIAGAPQAPAASPAPGEGGSKREEAASAAASNEAPQAGLALDDAESKRARPGTYREGPPEAGPREDAPADALAAKPQAPPPRAALPALEAEGAGAGGPAPGAYAPEPPAVALADKKDGGNVQAAADGDTDAIGRRDSADEKLAESGRSADAVELQGADFRDHADAAARAKVAQSHAAQEEDRRQLGEPSPEVAFGQAAQPPKATAPASAGLGATSALAKEAPPIPAADATTPPELVHRVEPAWPAAPASCARGTVRLECVVTAAGAVEVRRTLDSLPCFDAAAIDAVSRWRYVPARKDGRPQAVVITVELATGPRPR